MIIQIRGTSGSGKSTVMREVLARIEGLEPRYTKGRKRPLYYISPSGILVLGHYETVTGGCDTIGSNPEVFRTIYRLPPYKVLLCEGLLLSEDVIHTKKIVKAGQEVVCLFLSTKQDDCLTRIRQRQKEAHRKPLDYSRVLRKMSTRVGTIKMAWRRLVDSDILCRRCTCDQVPRILCHYITQSIGDRSWIKSSPGFPSRQSEKTTTQQQRTTNTSCDLSRGRDWDPYGRWMTVI